MFDSNWLAENSSILKKYLDIILSFQLVEKEPRLLQTLSKERHGLIYQRIVEDS